MSRSGLSIHFYCKLAVVLITLPLSFVAPSTTRCLYLMAVLSVFALLQLHIRNTLYFWGFFLALLALLAAYQHFSWSDEVVSRYTFITMRNSMPSFFALFILGSTPVSEITSGFDSLRFPKRTGIALVTLFRYLPTLGNDLKISQENLKVRGLLRAERLFAHPARTAEYFLAPLMARLYSTAEELAISATTRGAESDTRRTSLYGKRFGLMDAVLLTITIPALFAVLLV
jgi:energy-coupling factor transport system permease protein